MKKIILLLLLFITNSCSKQETINEAKSTTLPTNITFSAQAIGVGETLTINGNGFRDDADYIVTFTDNIIGNITEINANFLTVLIPETAISGNVTLTLGDTTEVIGNIDILPVTNSSNLYIFHDSENKLAKIDLVTGNLAYLGSDIEYGSNTRGAVYHSVNNEYIGFKNDFTGPSLIRINVIDGSVVSTNIPNSFLTNGTDFSDLIIDDNNEIYIFHDSVNKLAKIDLNNGNLTYIGENINYGANTRGAIYYSPNNEYIGFENDFNNPNLVRINITDGSVNNLSIPSLFLTNGADFSDLIINDNDEVYIFHDSVNKLAKIDLITGNLTYVGNNINYGINTRGAVFNSVTTEYIGFENDFTNPYLISINLVNGNKTTINISDSFLTNGADFSDLVTD